jgi:hypothetical protein
MALKIAGGIIGAIVIVLAAVMAPDIKRYLKIRSM